jgi:hypothetical protein
MSGPVETYAQTGAIGLLVVVAAGVIAFLVRRLDRCEREMDEVRDAGDALLKAYRERDAEELRVWREESKRRRGEPSS